MKAVACGWVGRAALLGLLAAVACEQPSKDAGAPAADPGSLVLARVGDEVVTVDDLGWVPARVKPADRLEMLVTRKLAAQEARRRGLANDPKTHAKLAQFRFSALTWEENLLRNALFNSIRLGFKFSEDELRAHYEATQSRYIEPQWTLRVMSFSSEAEARAAEAKLGATGRLDPGNSQLLGPVPASGYTSVLQPFLPLLKQPGDRQILEDRPGAWSLVELVTYLPATPLDFELVRERVDQDLAAVRAETALKAELERLRAERVVIDQAALATVEKQKAQVAADVRARRAADAQGEAAPAEAAKAEPASGEAAPDGETP